MIGQTISHYKILEKLGGGGMGVVYKAQDLKLGRYVALKFLPPDLTRDPEAKERFIHEAQAASALDHNNICNIHEIGETDDGHIFIAMACYEGESLKKKIERGPLKIEDAIDFSIQAAQGLAKAHEKGIVHRDIKPANVLITTDSVVKIVDFGLAKLAGQTKLTKAGSTLGTIAYMSPEQARGEDVERRADIWSLGVMMYEMITGQLPFKGEYQEAVVYSILNEEPAPVTGLRTGVPMELERIINKCMEKRPDERYQHADELVTDLRRTKTSLSTPSSKRPPEMRAGGVRRRVPRWPWVGVIVVLAAAAIAVLSRYRPPSPIAPAPERKMLAVLPFVNLGSPEEEYFAAGMTEEITSRLATIKELGVISRTSAVHYAGTTKTIKQIGDELGIQYVLEGTVRWERGPKGASRVRITPQLIRVSDDTHLWSEIYDRVMKDIFEIQSNIAQNVVDHLGLTLLEGGRAAVERWGTTNLDAYDAYLRGMYYASQPHFVARNWEAAVRNFQQAVQLDSGFAAAYAKLSEAHARLYYYQFDLSQDRSGKAGAAVNKALSLDPTAPQSHLALGYYHLFVERSPDEAFKEFDIAAQTLPENAEILEARANSFRESGRWAEALDQGERACALDPRSASLWENLGETRWWVRRYPEALEAEEKSITLSPDQMWAHLDKAFNYWSWRGKDALKEARAALESVGSQTDPDWIVWAWFNQAACERNYAEALGYLNSFPNDWIRIKIAAFPKSLLSAQIHELAHEPALARSDYESARKLLELEVHVHPDDPRCHSALGIAYAALDKREEAVREGKRAVDLLPMTKDAVYGIPYVIDLAQIFVMVGDQDAALVEIERLLARPSWISPAWLEMDFRWDRLRDNPKFKQLIEKYSKGES